MKGALRPHAHSDRDVALDFSVEKAVDPTSVPETEGEVAYTITGTNNTAEPATLTSLSDPILGGELLKEPVPIAGGGPFKIEVPHSVPAGEAGKSYPNTVTATVTGGESNESEEASAEVTYEDVNPPSP